FKSAFTSWPRRILSLVAAVVPWIDPSRSRPAAAARVSDFGLKGAGLERSTQVWNPRTNRALPAMAIPTALNVTFADRYSDFVCISCAPENRRRPFGDGDTSRLISG